MNKKQKVIFICTGNSCRSQMAEGFLRNIAGNLFDVYSAGSNPSKVHPNAISVMKELNWSIRTPVSFLCYTLSQATNQFSLYMKEPLFDSEVPSLPSHQQSLRVPNL